MKLPFRIGQGWDIHRIGDQTRALRLGGIELSPSGGCLAHSDGDVLLHALVDGLLGALSLGDIGQWFPDSDPKYKDCDSAIFLQPVLSAMHLEGYTIANIDCTCFLEKPKISPFFHKIRENIARLCNIAGHQLNLKAKTAEGLGIIGHNKAVACSVTVLLHADSVIQ